MFREINWSILDKKMNQMRGLGRKCGPFARPELFVEFFSPIITRKKSRLRNQMRQSLNLIQIVIPIYQILYFHMYQTRAKSKKY